MNKIYENESGQSTIEFLSTFVFVVSFLVLFLKIGIHYTNGYLVHYATFMASRTYLVSDNNSNTPEGGDFKAAADSKKVFESYKLQSFIPNFKNQLEVNTVDSVNNYPYVGVFTEFDASFSASGIIGGKKPVHFVSESFLGREPTRATCLDRICDAMKETGGDCAQYSTFSDNGC